MKIAEAISKLRAAGHEIEPFSSGGSFAYMVNGNELTADQLVAMAEVYLTGVEEYGKPNWTKP